MNEAVTLFLEEADKLGTSAEQLPAGAGKEQVAKLMQDASELCRELNTRWIEVTQRVVELQSRLLTRCASAAARWQGRA